MLLKIAPLINEIAQNATYCAMLAHPCPCLLLGPKMRFNNGGKEAQLVNILSIFLCLSMT